jgi:rare lipoprotein A
MLSAFESSLLFSQEKRDSLITSGKASFYADHFHGRETSSGDYYNKNDFTAAHRTLPFNTVVSVTNKRNGKSVIVRINDRGPFVKSRIIDLSKSAAQKLEMVPYGVVPVRIHLLNVLDYLPLNDSLMKDGDAWDCYGNKKALNKQSIYIWSTDNVKHAFYMAAGISLDYDVDSVAVNVSGRDASRRYKLYALNVKEKDKLIYQLRKDGFRQARVQP